MPRPTNIQKSAQETLVHVTTATVTDLQLGVKFSYFIRAAKTSRENEVAPHFTLQLKDSVRNPADVCYTGKTAKISVKCGVNHPDFPKRPYGFVYDALAGCVLHP